MEDFEKLGAFYLGREFDLRAGKPLDALVLYDSKDLVTHAVCVGMTGSGKTGLCIGLLEEAAIDGVPAIIIDPKGDLANLLLTFPDLKPQDFRPWINEDDARRKSVSPDEFAAQQAKLWQEGLGKWGQDGARIQRLRDSAEFAIYTPGSNAGQPVSILKSFAVPSQAVLDDNELFQDQIRTTVTGLLGLVGVDSDPMTSREHILLSTIVAASWKAGKDLDLAALIHQIQDPPVKRVGVMDVESFFPQKDRFALAMRLNNLLAAPGFETWLTGHALDIGALLHAQSGKPRMAIFSIAHLSDAERMFFVSLLLNQILGWTRTQSGTTSLRAIVYMDEIFGYFPPVANPPSKQPLLTLLKQARAFGVGVVLATQNPVDLDYKGLANAGTWFIGRLQTDRDKQRVLDGLEGAAASASSNFNRAQMEQVLAGLGNRIFLMNNVHDDEPVVFETRWAMSYLRGPLTRAQIKQLISEKPVQEDPARPASAGRVETTSAPHRAPDVSNSRPVLPPEIPQYFIPIRSSTPAGASLIYEPGILGSADVYFHDTKSRARTQQQRCLLAWIEDGPVPLEWSRAQELLVPESDLETAPAEGASFAPLPSAAGQAKSFAAWSKAFPDALYRAVKLDLLHSPSLDLTSRPDESEREFRARLALEARQRRDEQVQKLRQKWAPKITQIQERIRKAQMQVGVQSEQARGAKLQTAISFGATIFGALFGRKRVSAGTIGKATTSARGVGRSMKESQDVARAQMNVEALQEQLANLESQLTEEVHAMEARFDPAGEDLERIPLRPRKTDVKPRVVALAWAPFWRTAGPGGVDSPAW